MSFDRRFGRSPSFTPIETSVRHAVVDKSIELAHDALQDPNIARELGTRTLLLANALERLYVPNVNHGLVEWGNMPDDALPVIAAAQADELRLDKQFNQPFPVSSQVSEATRAHLLQEDERVINEMTGSVSGYVSGNLFAEDRFGRYVYFSQTPLMVLSMQQAAKSGGGILPEPTLHELMHLTQHERIFLRSYPPELGTSWLPAELLSMELEAYSISAAVAAGTESKRPASRRSLTIEKTRQQFNDFNDPWRSSSALAKRISYLRYSDISPGIPTNLDRLTTRPKKLAKEWEKFNLPTSSLQRLPQNVSEVAS